MNNETNTIELARPTLDLTLFAIDEGIRGLLEYRQERLADTENPPDAEELGALEGEIARYFEALPKKVAGIAAVDRHWEAQLTTLLGPKDKNGNRRGGEIDRLKSVAKNIEEMRARLRECCAVVLEKQPEPAKGSRKLVGADGSQIMLKRNGGVLPLLIDNQELLPDDCCRMVGWVRADLWELAVDMVRELSQRGTRINDFSLRREPDPEAIRAKLAKPCDGCDGVGTFSVDLAKDVSETHLCAVCGGSGKNAVPGARLGERGSHVEVR